MNSKPTRHSIDTLFTFLLLLSFLLFSLLVAGTGSMVYQNGTDSLNKNYTSRMALSYLAEKLRQHDHTDGVNVRELDNIPSLVLYEEQNGTHYCTYLYFYDRGAAGAVHAGIQCTICRYGDCDHRAVRIHFFCGIRPRRL